MQKKNQLFKTNNTERLYYLYFMQTLSILQPMGNVEPPACIQNAMMTKDKKPFTYTPGGLDLSQIRTPSMARRLNRQRSQEEHEQQYAPNSNFGGGAYRPQGGPPPPPPPPQIPAPPPPPPLVIEAPSKSPKPVPLGERPEIVIPENPIGMLRKTNSPYHWEAEKAEMQRVGPVPKFVDKVPSPLTVKMPPSSFSQQPPQMYTPQGQNNFSQQNYPYGQQHVKTPESPIHRPEAQYANQKSASPNANGSPLTRELLQRQDSLFNKSPQPFAGQSPISNGSPYSPSPNNNWRQPERRDSPANIANSPQSPQLNRNQFSPNVQQYSPVYQNQTSPANSSPVFHTLPRSAPKIQDNYVSNTQNNNTIYNNTREAAPQSPKMDTTNPTPWRSNTLNRQPREVENQQTLYNNSHAKNNQSENNYIPPWKQESKSVENQQQQQQYTPPWVSQDANNNRSQKNYSPPWRTLNNNENRSAPVSPPSKPSQPQEQPRYQSTMSIPVTARKQNPHPEYNNNNNTNNAPQKEVVYVNQEPVYFCPESPKSIPPWVKTQKEKTKTPPPAWCQRPLDGRKSLPRELVTPPRETNQEPEWVKKSNEMQRAAREVVSPPKYQQPAQPSWSTLPSENRKSLPRDNAPNSQGARVIPIQMELSSTELRDQGRQGNQQPPLRIVINMQPQSNGQGSQAPFSQPTQRIMRVLSPQLVRMDDGPTQSELPTLNRNFQSNQDNTPKERIIPIQIEGSSNGGAKNR